MTNNINVIGTAQWGSNKEKARLNKLFKIRKKFIKRLNMDKDYKYGGYTPIGRLDTSKPPLGRSGVKSPPSTLQVNVHIYSENIASVCVASVGGSIHCPYPSTESISVHRNKSCVITKSN